MLISMPVFVRTAHVTSNFSYNNARRARKRIVKVVSQIIVLVCSWKL